MGKIIQENYPQIGNSVLNADSRRNKKDMLNLVGQRKERVVIPDVGNIIRKSPTIRKSAERGKLLENSMRGEMRKIVKRGLLADNITTATGTVRKSSAKSIEKELNLYFEGYTKKNPKFGMPSNKVARVLAGTARRITRVLASRAEGDDDALARDEPLLATLARASLLTRIATGPHAGERWRRLGDRVDPQDPRWTPKSGHRGTPENRP